jgi:hypothetical protein
MKRSGKENEMKANASKARQKRTFSALADDHGSGKKPSSIRA